MLTCVLACGRIDFDPLDAAPPPAPRCTSGWCWEYPLPQGETVRAMSGTSANDVWAACGDGQVAHYDGMTWSFAQAADTHHSLSGIWAAAPDNVWAVSDSGGVTHFDGARWTEMTLPLERFGTTQLGCTGIYGFGANDIWAACFSGDAAHYDGTSWTRVAVDTGITDLYGVYGGASNDIWITGDSGRVFHWDGATWTRVTLAMGGIFQSAWGTGTTDIWTGGYQGAIWHYDGATWTQAPVVGTNPLEYQSGWVMTANDVWASSVGAPLGRGNLATGFTDVSWPGLDVIYAFWGSAPDNIWMGGEGGRLYRWNGSDWSSPFPVGAPSLTATSGTSANDVWAVGQFGTILHRDATRTWSRRASPTTSLLEGVAAFAPEDVWIAGRDSVFRFDGTGWTEVLHEVGTEFTDIAGTSRNDVWVISTAASNVDVRHFDGATWTTVLANGGYHALWVRGPGDVWLARDNDVLHLEGTTWVTKYTDTFDMPSSITGTSPDDVWAMGPQSLAHWDGVTWTTYAASLLQFKQTMRDGWALSPTDAWFVGDFAMFHWDGVDVTEVIPRPAGTRLKAVTGVGNEMWAVGQSGTIIHR